MITRLERMNIIAIARANVGKYGMVLPQALVCHFNILCPGELCIIRRTFDNANSNFLPFGNGGIVGKVGAVDCEGFLMCVKIGA